MTPYVFDQHQEFVKKVVHLLDEVYGLVRRYATTADRIEVTIITLSVITSGALWALAADAAPKQLGWAGAALSTVVTFLTIYLYAAGLQKKRKKALLLHAEVSAFLGQLRGNHDIDEAEFWSKYKLLDNKLTELRYERVE